MQHHKYSLTEIEAMLPWERDVYVSLLINYIKEENEKQKQKRPRKETWREEQQKEIKQNQI